MAIAESIAVRPFAPETVAGVRSAYLHVPFCSHKCGYCDFASVAGHDDAMVAYVEALAAEVDAHLVAPVEVDTIFVGGGTPTYLPVDLLERLLENIGNRFHLAAAGEFTVESNPNTLTQDKANVLANAGVNRISLGAQSFHPHLLKALERDHDPASVGRAADLVRRRIGNFSIDLIFGVPGQTVDEWTGDLDAVIALEPNHLSTYGLTYEKGTPLWRQRKLGVVIPVDEEIERSMFETAMDRLDGAGWKQYEISNFSQPGRECRHNLAYWANKSCFGFGVGAASYVGGSRRLNLRDVDSYIRRAGLGLACAIQSETLAPEERARETAMLNLRRMCGLERSDFESRTSHSIDALAGPQIERFVHWNLLNDDGATIRLTRQGVFVADAVLREIV